MAFNQQDFRKDKANAVNVRAVAALEHPKDMRREL
jgi:hypothetical protein